MDTTGREGAPKGKEKHKNRLRSERELRGWSREFVADKIGSDTRSVGRWERGATSPNPYYRQALCELFRMNAAELGLLKEDGQEKEDSVQPLRPAEKELLTGEERLVERSIEAAPESPLPPIPEKPTFPSPPSSLLTAPYPYSPTVSQMSMWSMAGIIALSIVVFMLCTTLFALFTWRVLPSALLIPGQMANTTSNIKPGGLWVSPTNGQIVRSIINFAAKAYPTNPGDPPINHVNFTMNWKGGGWRIACTTYPPVIEDLFTCTANLTTFSAPPGTIQISFDVYDQGGHIDFAPNGVHKVIYVP